MAATATHPMTESHFICPTDFNQGRNFDREACRRHCPCEVDFIGALVAGYQAEVRRNWERCLDMKWSMQDYVSGCHNADEDADRLDRNGHQYRLYLENIKKLAKFLTGKDEEYWAQFANSDFEELYDILSKEIRKHKGIGELSTYDTILRLGWNYRKRIAPQSFVYLHAGAFEGAKALARISDLKRRKYIDMTEAQLTAGKKGGEVCKIDIRLFHRSLRLLDANHLENFLCVFHTPLEAYADFLEREKHKKQ